MRRTLLLISSAFLFVMLAYHTGEPAEVQKEVPATPHYDGDRMKATLAKLADPVTLDFVDTPLEDVIQFITAYVGERSKISTGDKPVPDEKISINVQSRSLGQALEMITGGFGWTYAVLPDGEILLLPAPKKKAD